MNTKKINDEFSSRRLFTKKRFRELQIFFSDMNFIHEAIASFERLHAACLDLRFSRRLIMKLTMRDRLLAIDCNLGLCYYKAFLFYDKLDRSMLDKAIAILEEALRLAQKTRVALPWNYMKILYTAYHKRMRIFYHPETDKALIALDKKARGELYKRYHTADIHDKEIFDIELY
jgi:tetratricopeptide (TPR) repeat protein